MLRFRENRLESDRVEDHRLVPRLRDYETSFKNEIWPANLIVTGQIIAPIHSISNLKLKFFLFKLFFLFNYSFVNSPFVGNAFSALFNVVSAGPRIIIVNLRRFASRWLTSYDFIFNLHYFNITRLLLSSPLFHEQSLALN